MLGESPPPPPRDCFGRSDLIESVVRLAEGLDAIALVGAGGIGKTSIALTVLHHDRIKERFGDNRRFIRCDKFQPSQANFLSRLSKIIGAGIENPKDLTPLRPSLSSEQMFIVLDNAESILDPKLPEGQEIYHVVEELSQFTNISLVITSRITVTPSSCETIRIPTLSKQAACEAFYRIYKYGERSDSVDNILERLDFHPLSITLLATVAHQNNWDNNRLAREWEERRMDVLLTEHSRGFGVTIELSLASPMFKSLGPNARDLLGVIAFFPQGINEDNLDWLFPTTPDVATTLDKFCMLSLTYRSGGFITMLVPLRDYLCPKDPLSSPLLRTVKESYFTRLSAKPDPLAPGTEETRWITSEDTNVEHFLNFLTSVDPNSDRVWRACSNFTNFLYWHKPRHTVLGPKTNQLPDSHRSKPDCLFQLALLFDSLGNYAEEKQLLDHTLKLERERGNDYQVALTLARLCDANRMLGLDLEGANQAEEALGIFERIGDIAKQGYCLAVLAFALDGNHQLEAAEEAASRAIQLLPEKGEEYTVCESHRVLGDVHSRKAEREKAICHYETALRIASSFNWNDQLFWIHYRLAELFCNEGGFDNAHVQIQQAKLHAVDNAYNLARAVELQARIYFLQHRFEDATSDGRRALEIYEKLGNPSDAKDCRDLLQDAEGNMKHRDAPMVSFRE